MHLTEGRGAGFPLIYRAIENNESPPPKFITDSDRTYFLAVIEVHPEFIGVKVSDIVGVKVSDIVGDIVNDRVSDIVNDIVSDIVNDRAGDRVRKTLEFCLSPKKRKELLQKLELGRHSVNYYRYIKPLIEIGWLEMTEPKQSSRNQKYHTTKTGKILLQLISRP